MPKGFFKIPSIKGDMAQKLFTMYGAHDQNMVKFAFLNLNYSALLADKRPNEVPFNRP